MDPFVKHMKRMMKDAFGEPISMRRKPNGSYRYKWKGLTTNMEEVEGVMDKIEKLEPIARKLALEEIASWHSR